jgi:hypothetical protein
MAQQAEAPANKPPPCSLLDHYVAAGFTSILAALLPILWPPLGLALWLRAVLPPCQHMFHCPVVFFCLLPGVRISMVTMIPALTLIEGITHLMGGHTLAIGGVGAF